MRINDSSKKIVKILTIISLIFFIIFSPLVFFVLHYYSFYPIFLSYSTASFLVGLIIIFGRYGYDMDDNDGFIPWWLRAWLIMGLTLFVLETIFQILIVIFSYFFGMLIGLFLIMGIEKRNT